MPLPPTKIRHPRERLDLGPADGVFLDLAGRDGKQPGLGYVFELSADGIEWGDPEAVRRIVATLLQDGDDERTDRWGNVSTKFTIRILADDFAALGRGERDLAMQMGRRNSLRWTPPAERGDVEVPVTEFMVMTSDMYPRTTAADLLNYRSTWELEFRRLPWTRSTTPVTQTLTPSGGTEVVKNDATSLSGWASNQTLSLVTYLGQSAIKVTGPNDPNSYVTWSGNIGSTPYIFLDVAFDNPLFLGGIGSPRAFAIGSYLGSTGGRALGMAVQSTGFTRIYFDNPNPGGGVGFTLGPGAYIDKIGSATSVASRSMLGITPKGSVRTPAALDVAGGGGDIMVYSDPTMFSYGWVPDNSSTWQNAPAGTYAVYAKVGSSPTPTAKVFTATAPSGQVGRTKLSAAPTPDVFFPVDALQLGNQRTGRLGSGGGPSVAPVGGSGSVTEVRLFRMDDDTALTYVRGLGAATLSIDIPSIDLPRGGLWANGVSILDQADTWGIPVIEPPITPIWVWSSALTNVPITATYYPQWRLFAAE